MTSTLIRTKSAANSASRSLRPSPQRKLDRNIVTFDPAWFTQSLDKCADPLRRLAPVCRVVDPLVITSWSAIP